MRSFRYYIYIVALSYVLLLGSSLAFHVSSLSILAGIVLILPGLAVVALGKPAPAMQTDTIAYHPSRFRHILKWTFLGTLSISLLPFLYIIFLYFKTDVLLQSGIADVIIFCTPLYIVTLPLMGVSAFMLLIYDILTIRSM